jgi:protein SCO1/2
MHSRRNLLARFTTRVAKAIPGVRSDGSDHAFGGATQNTSSCDCSRPHNGPYAHHFPNVVVQTHEGQRALFYDDLLRGKMVMINCMSVKNDALFPVSRNLANVQRLLRDRVGRSLFMYSITVDPEHDTPRVLKAFADKHGAGPGWMFLTGEPAGIQSLRSRLFISGEGNDHSDCPPQDCSLALIRYGNEAVGLWGSVPAKTAPELIAMRLSWIRSEQPTTGTPRRAGPHPLE